MFINQVGTISTLVDPGATYVASAITVVVTRPDGTVDVSSPTTTAAIIAGFGSTILTGQNLSFNYVPSMAGDYTYALTLTITKGSQSPQTFTVGGDFFVTWRDVIGMVRELLQVDSTIATDLGIIRTFRNRQAVLQREYANLELYTITPLANRSFLDEGLAYLTATFMRPYLPKATAVGELAGFSRGSTHFQYSSNIRSIRRGAISTPEEVWDAMGWDSLRNIQNIATTYDKRLQTCILMPTRGDRVTFDELFSEQVDLRQYTLDVKQHIGF